jgi:hypothetical protein
MCRDRTNSGSGGGRPGPGKAVEPAGSAVAGVPGVIESIKSLIFVKDML